jgi:hypothetical protein
VLQGWPPQGFGRSVIERRTIAARIISAIHPKTRPSAGFTITVTSAIAPMTQRHDGLPSPAPQVARRLGFSSTTLYRYIPAIRTANLRGE